MGENMNEHEIIKRKKVEDDFIPVNENSYSEYYLKKKRTNEYDYFSCEKSNKIVLLDSWDFNFCPFCGEKVK